MLVNAGDIAQQRLYDGTGVYDFVNSTHSLTKGQFKELLSYTNDSSFLISFVAHVVSRLYDVISFVPDKVAKLLDSATGFIGNKARIDESVWNPKKRKHAEGFGDVLSAIESRLNLVNKKVNKLTAKENTIVPEAMKAPLRTLQDILRSFQSFSRSLADSIQGASELLIAFVCGVWNALIDLVNGLLTLCSLLLKVPGAIGNVAGGSDEFPYFYQLFKEYMDNFIQSVAAIDWAEVFSEIGQGFIDLMVAIPEKLQELSAAEVGYYSGYIAFNIAEFFFPLLKIAKLAKAGKLAEGFAEMVADMSKVAQNMANAGRKVGRAVTQAPKKAYDFALDMLDNLTNLLRQGTATVKELVQKMFERIRVWLDDAIGQIKVKLLFPSSGEKGFLKLIPYDSVYIFIKTRYRRIMRSAGLRLAFYEKEFALVFEGIVLKVGTQQEIESFLVPYINLKRKELIQTFRRLALILHPYSIKYPIRKLKPLIDNKTVLLTFSATERSLISEVNALAESLIGTLSRKALEKKTMISGMAYKQGDKVRVFWATNFTKTELSQGLHKVFLDKELHPLLKRRISKHLKLRNANELPVDIQSITRAGEPATHGEIRALNKLLNEIDPKGVLGEEVFEQIIGYNRFLRMGANSLQPPCAHCFYLTFGIKFIGFN